MMVWGPSMVRSTIGTIGSNFCFLATAGGLVIFVFLGLRMVSLDYE